MKRDLLQMVAGCHSLSAASESDDSEPFAHQGESLGNARMGHWGSRYVSFLCQIFATLIQKVFRVPFGVHHGSFPRLPPSVSGQGLSTDMGTTWIHCHGCNCDYTVHGYSQHITRSSHSHCRAIGVVLPSPTIIQVPVHTRISVPSNFIPSPPDLDGTDFISDEGKYFIYLCEVLLTHCIFQMSLLVTRLLSLLAMRLQVCILYLKMLLFTI